MLYSTTYYTYTNTSTRRGVRGVRGVGRDLHALKAEEWCGGHRAGHEGAGEEDRLFEHGVHKVSVAPFPS